jgi:DNA-3-methyladenine glycosylase II
LAAEVATDAYRRAALHLAQIDADWARLVRLVGPCTHQPKPEREPYQALVRAVAYQQLHARAGDAILARLQALYPQVVFPSPAQLLATDVAELRGCGFSARKTATLHAIAAGAVDGLVPARAAAERMDDAELITRLTALPGIGRWTVEMLLIYTLERLDILPADDFSVRDGWRRLKSLPALPSRRQMEQAALPCSPWRTVAAWYLWRLPAAPALTAW